MQEGIGGGKSVCSSKELRGEGQRRRERGSVSDRATPTALEALGFSPMLEALAETCARAQAAEAGPKGPAERW